MGTPDFSVNALNAIAKSGHNIQLVVTQPDRPKGRGRKITPSPVKTAGQDLGIEIFQPEDINLQKIIKKLKSLEPDFFVVVAFGQKLSQEVLNIPRIYPINIHASLLPCYRGSSPIQAAIANMDKTTGVTTMVMDKELDKGDILLSSKIIIGHNETFETLHNKLSNLGGKLICQTLTAISKDNIIPIPQNHKKASYAPMLKKSDGKINWEESSEKICAKIRAMTPWPGAFTYLNNTILKIFKAEPIKETRPKTVPGAIIESADNELHVGSGNGIVNIIELMGKSGKRLKAQDFLRGHQIKQGSKFNTNDS